MIANFPAIHPLKKVLPYIRTHFLQGVSLVFLFVVITIALFIKLIIVNNADTRSTAGLIAHTYNISRYVEKIQAELAESESATRGYLLTGDLRWRETAKKSQQEIIQSLGEINRLVIDEAQQKNLEQLTSLANEKILFQQSVTDRDTLLPGIAGQMRFDGEERQNAIAIHAIIGLFMDRQTILLQQRTQASELANNRAQVTVISGMAVVFLFITGTLLKLNKDIRRRKRAEVDIRESERKYRILIEDAGVTIFTCDFAGTFTYVSGKCQALTGFKPEELTGQSFAKLVSPDWLLIVADEYKTQLSQLWNETTIEFPIITANGKEKWVEQHAVLMFDEHHSPVGYQCMVKDITEKKNQEEKIPEIKWA